MATCQNETVNAIPQAPYSWDYFVETYRHYCKELTAIQAVPADAPDDAMEKAQNEADQTRDNILTARATTLPQLALKLKVLMQDEKDSMHASGFSGAMASFALLAADLDCIITAGGNPEARHPVSMAQPFDPDFWPHTFEEWSAAVAENDGNGNGAADTEDKLYSHMLKCHTTTPGDAALKMRVVLHSLFVSDARSQFPGQCAALSDVVADLERQDAAGKFARRAGKAVRS